MLFRSEGSPPARPPGPRIPATAAGVAAAASGEASTAVARATANAAAAPTGASQALGAPAATAAEASALLATRAATSTTAVTAASEPTAAPSPGKPHGSDPRAFRASDNGEPQALSPPQQRSPGLRGLSSWQPLPGTEREARALAPVLGSKTVISGPAATSSLVLRQRAPRLLHIATHGFFLADPAPAAGSAPGASQIGRAHV